MAPLGNSLIRFTYNIQYADGDLEKGIRRVSSLRVFMCLFVCVCVCVCVCV